MDKKKIAIILGCTAFIVTFLISIQLKTIADVSKTSDIGLVEDGLRDEVVRWRDRYNNIYQELGQAEKALEEERRKITEDNEESTEKEEKLKINNTILGLTDVSGKGVSIILRDTQSITADSINKEDNINNYLIHSEDLVMIVNELKNAGAEAISINDKRIVSTSSIICAGNVAEINAQKIGVPFTIKAIGVPEMLYGALTRPGGYIEILESFGIGVEIKKANTIEIGRYNGVLSFKTAQSIQ